MALPHQWSDPKTVSIHNNSLELIATYNTQGKAMDVFVSGSYAYTWGDFLEVINVSTPYNPIGVGQVSVGSAASAEEIFVSGNYVYAAAGTKGLKIFDVSDKSNPTYISSYLGWQDVTGIHVVDTIAYLATAYAFAGKHGLPIVDVSDPSDPTPLGWFETPAQAEKVFVVWPYAYLLYLDGFVSWLQIINISDPLNPTLTGNFQITFSIATGVFVSERLAYVSGWNWGSPGGGVQIIDVTNPSWPTNVGEFSDSCGTDIFVSGNYAFLGEGANGLKAIDVSNPSTPREVGFFECGSNIEGVYVSGQYVYVACSQGGIAILRFRP
jgi:hypothetical protein